MTLIIGIQNFVVVFQNVTVINTLINFLNNFIVDQFKKNSSLLMLKSDEHN